MGAACPARKMFQRDGRAWNRFDLGKGIFKNRRNGEVSGEPLDVGRTPFEIMLLFDK